MDEQYLGDIPEQAQIRNLDTGEVISYEQADLLRLAHDPHTTSCSLKLKLNTRQLAQPGGHGEC